MSYAVKKKNEIILLIMLPEDKDDSTLAIHIILIRGSLAVYFMVHIGWNKRFGESILPDCSNLC